MDNKTQKELIDYCKINGIRGYSGKNKDKLRKLIMEKQAHNQEPLLNTIINGNTIQILPTIGTETAQIIIADPPYNIGKDFGNNSDKQPLNAYLEWTDVWLKECLRILKPNGPMFVYGFSEILALITARVPYEINRRWIIWHYTNKNVASLHFWQRSHESILVLWKDVERCS